MAFLPVNANSFTDPVTQVVCMKLCIRKKFIAKIVKCGIIYRFKTSNLKSEGDRGSTDRISAGNKAISHTHISENIQLD